MKMRATVVIEMDVFNKDSAQRRIDDLLSKTKCKKFAERQTEVKSVLIERIDE